LLNWSSEGTLVKTIMSCATRSRLITGAAVLLALTGGISAQSRVPRLTDSAVAAIQNVAKTRSRFDFGGLSEYDHGTQKILVTSNRATIAFRSAQAALGQRRYSPTPQERIDTVLVQCGDPDPHEFFECARVRVMRSDKTQIQPLSYSAGPMEYQSPGGETWAAYEVFALYAASDLSDGFLVNYLARDGSEFNFEVSAKDAEEKLLLKIPNEEMSPVI
jgi:hypothetical protein